MGEKRGEPCSTFETFGGQKRTRDCGGCCGNHEILEKKGTCKKPDRKRKGV